MLLPGKYAAFSDYSSYDVRSNLRSFRRKQDDFRYCVVFRVDKATATCDRSEDTSKLDAGETVCVMCDSKAQRAGGHRCHGHGANGRRTRFKNLMNPRCHGKWTRMEVDGECPCGTPDFVFA